MSETPPPPFDDQHDSSGHSENHPNLPGLDDLVDSGWEHRSEEAQQVFDSLQPLEALRDTPPVEDVLVHATLARIKATPRPSDPKSTVPTPSTAAGIGSGSGFNFRLHD